MAKKRFRLMVLGLFHETHCFLGGSTQWNEFDVREGTAMLQSTGDSSPLGGLLEYSDRNDWDVLPTLFASATPGPMVEAGVLDRFWNRFTEHALPGLSVGVDAIFFVLHGAFVCSDQLDVEGELLRRIRRMPGAETLPIFGVYDLHANFSQAMASNADCLVGYRENPHTDARESAIRSALLLSRSLLCQVRPRQVLRQVPIILPPTVTASVAQPMKRLLDHARRLEREHSSFWAVNINAGFAYSDTPDTGLSFSIVTEGRTDEAEAALDELASIAMEHLSECSTTEDSVERSLRRGYSSSGIGLQSRSDKPTSHAD